MLNSSRKSKLQGRRPQGPAKERPVGRARWVQRTSRWLGAAPDAADPPRSATLWRSGPHKRRAGPTGRRRSGNPSNGSTSPSQPTRCDRAAAAAREKRKLCQERRKTPGSRQRSPLRTSPFPCNWWAELPTYPSTGSNLTGRPFSALFPA